MSLSEINPFAWERCDHSGIGQPGCRIGQPGRPTCDPNKSRCLQRARYLAYIEVTAEREACAAIAKGMPARLYCDGGTLRSLADEIAAAILARGAA